MPVSVNISYPANGVGVVAFADPPRNFGSSELAVKIMEAVHEVEAAGCRVFVLASDTPGYFIAHWSLQFIIDRQSALQAGGNRIPPPAPRIFDAIFDTPMISIAPPRSTARHSSAPTTSASRSQRSIGSMVAPTSMLSWRRF